MINSIIIRLLITLLFLLPSIGFSADTLLTVTVTSSNSTQLSWKAPTNFSGTIAFYKIFRNNALVTSSVKANFFTYTDKGLAPGSYTYKIQPCDTKGTCLFWSNEVTIDLTTQTITGIPASERTVLINLYNSTHGNDWRNNTNWNGPIGTECTWWGVVCNDDKTHVIAISQDLSSNNLIGTLPSLSGLTYLQEFWVNGNQLTGLIPPISGLKQLSVFVVSDNKLTGSLPAISGLTLLIKFDVSNNLLSGPVSAPPKSLISDTNLCGNNLITSGNSSIDSAWVIASGDWLSCQINAQIVIDLIAPTTPLNVKTTLVSTNKIDLSWSASTDNIGVTSYKVYRNGALLITLGNVLIFNDTGLDESTTYTYKIIACDANENCSEPSILLSVTTKKSTIVQAPKLTVTVINTNSIKLVWTAPIGIDGVVATYNIYRNGILIKMLSNNILIYNDIDVSASTLYSYKIEPCNSDNVCWLSSDLIEITTPASILTTNTSTSNVDSDCVFIWGEQNYPELLAPASPPSKSFPPYYYRYYSSTNSYLGTSSIDNHLYYIGVLSGNKIMDLGAIDKWKQTAGCQ